MNNSRVIPYSLREDKVVDRSPWLRERQDELGKIIEALTQISQSVYWKTLEEKLFKGVAESIEKKLRSESDEKELYRLQGQAVWAMKFLDIGRLREVYRQELISINTKLNGQK